MNWYRVIATVLIGSISFNLYAQSSIPFSKSSYIEPYKLEVTYNKTTNLVFPSSIISIDRGSQDIMVQKVSGVENILRLKADIKSFEETNLSVITKDGKLYSFLVGYNNNPGYLNVNLGSIDETNPVTSSKEEPVIYSPPIMNERSLAAYASKAASAKINIHGVSDKSYEMYLALKGFYIKDNIMFCRLKLENHSTINYDIDQLRFYIRDKKQSKRTATQEIEMHPLYMLGDTVTLKGSESETLVISVPKFTIPDGKYMVIEIMEKNGGRHLTLKARNRHIVKAMTIDM